MPKFTGKVKRFFFKELTQTEIDRLVNVPKKGMVQIDEGKTHKMSVEDENGVWYQWGSVKFRPGDPMVFRRDIEDDGNWINIYNGCTVTFQYKESVNGQYTNRNIKKATFILDENGPKDDNLYIYKAGEADNQNDSSPTKSSYDPTGAMKGNAFNNAMILANYKLDDKNIVLTYMKKIFDINKRLQSKVSVPGVVVGMAINNAVLSTKNIEVVEETALNLLGGVIKQFDDYVDGGCVDTPEQDSLPYDIDEDDIPF